MLPLAWQRRNADLEGRSRGNGRLTHRSPPSDRCPLAAFRSPLGSPEPL